MIKNLMLILFALTLSGCQHIYAGLGVHHENDDWGREYDKTIFNLRAEHHFNRRHSLEYQHTSSATDKTDYPGLNMVNWMVKIK